MWLLLMIVLTSVPGVSHTTVLETYRSRDECLSERERITAALQQSYPDDRDFFLVCRLKADKVCLPQGSNGLCT